MIDKYPLLKDIINTKEVFWLNPEYDSYEEGIKNVPLTLDNVLDAYMRLKRFAPFLESVYPEIKSGIIESPLIRIPSMKQELEKMLNVKINGDLLLKCDNDLPISGSIKARGGIYEVLKYAENLAIKHNYLTIDDNYEIINSNKFRNFFSQYKIAVASTGNLGLSIGIISAKLGFKVFVHMSRDAKAWKKELLRGHGVKVIEYESDYSEAVKKGREFAEKDPNMYFIDDENSKDLFLGYAVAALTIKEQLNNMNIKVDDNNPLHVYLPCGVGGGPGGITFGLKLLFKDYVRCFFAEPTHSPCMLIGLMTNLHDKISVQDIGLDNKTIADGLAVGRASRFVGNSLRNLISGVYTISDENLMKLLKVMYRSENIKLEPSALAGLYGVLSEKKYHKDKNITHIVWATGGGMVPKEVFNDYLNEL